MAYWGLAAVPGDNFTDSFDIRLLASITIGVKSCFVAHQMAPSTFFS